STVLYWNSLFVLNTADSNFLDFIRTVNPKTAGNDISNKIYALMMVQIKHRTRSTKDKLYWLESYHKKNLSICLLQQTKWLPVVVITK
ncbi:MAG: hypothetical protein V3R54_05195, partial [Thermodesulfovibrionia bacterium]